MGLGRGMGTTRSSGVAARPIISGFFLELVWKKGRPVGMAFFANLQRTFAHYPARPVFIEQQTDFSGCILYQGWTGFAAKQPKAYAAAGVTAGFEAFLRAFPILRTGGTEFLLSKIPPCCPLHGKRPGAALPGHGHTAGTELMGMNELLTIPEGFLFTSPPRAGRQLPAFLRRKLEAFFGADFTTVRVHIGPEASAIGASAFTTGEDLYFAPGRYAPHTRWGLRLLGHELAHVLQQRAGRVAHPSRAGLAVVWSAELEAEAEALGVALSEECSRSVQWPIFGARCLPAGPPHSRVIQCDLDGDSLSELSTLETLEVPAEPKARSELRTRAQELLSKDPTQLERKRIGSQIQRFQVSKSARSGPPPTLVRSAIDTAFQNKGTTIGSYFEKYLSIQVSGKDWKSAWCNVVANVWALGQDSKVGGPYYGAFFADLEVLLPYVSSEHLWSMMPGLAANFERLTSSTGKVNALGNYKGAVAEILDAIRSAAFNRDELDTIALPTRYKSIDEDLSQSMSSEKKKLLEQDIDRIERLKDGTKFYIEVKADVETAIEKHGKAYAGLQLVQIMAVIATRERLDAKRTGVDRKTKVRYPAVSILNPEGWMRLFTAGTAQLYVMNGYHLFIGGARFSPGQLKIIYDKVQLESKGREKDFFHANLKTFPDPRRLKKNLGSLGSMLNLDTLGPPTLTATSRFGATSSKAVFAIPSMQSLSVLGKKQAHLEMLQPELLLYAQLASEEDEDEALRDELEVSYTLHAISGDGNCLFRAISFLISRTQDRHAYWREQTIIHMRKYRSMFSDIDHAIDETYLLEMAHAATGGNQREKWGGYPEVYAIARILRCKIIVHSSEFTNGVFEIFEQLDPRFSPRPGSAPLHLFFAGGNHYEAMTARPG
jgi:hypothetical protein